MSRQVTHLFDTKAEALAFIAGVEWVNDSSITYDGYGALDKDEYAAAAVFLDEDADFDETIDHRTKEST